METIMALGLSTSFFILVLVILLLAMALKPSRPKYRGKVKEDISKIKKSIDDKESPF